MKKILKIGNAIGAVVFSGLFFAVSSMATEEMSNAEKIEFIDKIIETKIKEAGGGDVRSEVLAAVAEKMPLDGEETPETSAIINKIKQKVRQEYPLSDQELTEKYMPKAESLYPFYKPGDKANIMFLLHGKKFYVSGPYYRSDSKYVWVGSKKILKSTIPPEQACRFDEKATQSKRSEYIKGHIDAYHRKANNYENGLLGNQYDKLEASRGKIKINGKWQIARVVTEQKYAAADQQITNVILAVQRTLAKKFDIQNNEKCCQLLETFIRNYPNHKYAENAKELLEKLHEQKIVAVLQTVQESPDIESHEKCCRLLESIIREFPDHMHIEKAKKLLEKIKREYPIKLASREAVRQIVVDDSIQNVQIAIRKLINPGNKYKLIIFPIDRKMDAAKLTQTTEKIKQKFYQLQQNESDMQILQKTIDNFDVQSSSDVRRLGNLTDNLKAKTDNSFGIYTKIANLRYIIDLFFERDNFRNVARIFTVESDYCALSHIKTPVILFVCEKINLRFSYMGKGKVDYLWQGWYLEYTPGQTIEWKLE